MSDKMTKQEWIKQLLELLYRAKEFNFNCDHFVDGVIYYLKREKIDGNV